MLEGMNGVSAKTPENIPLGAGTIHKNLKYTKDKGWNIAESCIGATSGGNNWSVVPKIYYPPIDGVDVKLKETATMIGEDAKMEINMIELSKELIQASTLGKAGTSEDAEFDVIEPAGEVLPEHIWENISFVGKTLKGKKIIVIMGNPLCSSGMTNEGKNAESGVNKYTFECHASINDVNLNKLPWKIYYPKATTTTTTTT